MSNYTQTTFFAPKDSLVSGNPAKLIRGADVDPELAAIAVAIATKYDSTNISGGQVPFGAGTAAAPSITFAAALNTGIYLSAANTVGISANGAFEASFKGGQVLGAPTGGAKGVGTLNATGLFINGVAVSTSVGANPTALVGLATVNGVATTWMRSDASPPLDVTISPTWSGTHTFSGAGITTNFAGKVIIGAPSSGTPLTVNAPSLGNFATLSDGARTIVIGTNGTGAVQLGTTTNHEVDIFTNNITRIAIGNSGNITVTAPISGGHTFNVADASGVFISTANTSPYLRFGNSTDTNGFIVYTGTTMNLQTANATRVGISAAAGVVISAPTSGPALTVNGLAAATAIQVVTTSHSGNVDIDGANIIVGTNAAASGQSGLIRFRKDTGANAWYAGVLQTGAAVNFSIYDAVNAREVLNIAPGGNITINASSGTPLFVQANGTNIFEALGTSAPTIQGYGPNAAALVDMTPDTASYTGTLTGCTSSPTDTITLRRSGNTVVCNIGAVTAVSNANTATITGSMPASFQPAALDQWCPIVVEDNGSFVLGYAKITHASSTITLLRADGAVFATVGTKGVAQSTSFSYMLA